MKSLEYCDEMLKKMREKNIVRQPTKLITSWKKVKILSLFPSPLSNLLLKSPLTLCIPQTGTAEGPSWSELGRGEDFPSSFDDETFGIEGIEHFLDEMSDKLYGGDKLGGWPMWVQDIEYPTCKECNRDMNTMVFQHDGQELDMMFGDCGVGHITMCGNHPENVGFCWACSQWGLGPDNRKEIKIKRGSVYIIYCFFLL